MVSTAHCTHGVAGTITNFADELLCQVLKRLDLTTKLQAHTVCRQWNHVLSAPCCADLWTVVPQKTMAGKKLTTLQCQEDIEHYTQWLAARASGIPRADIVTEQWTSPKPDRSVHTEARFFVEKQLPFLLGYLHRHTKQLDIALTTDAKLMGCPLINEHLLLTCLGESLVQLNLTVYSDDPPYDDFDMDCLSSMKRLQHLHIQSMGQHRTWKTRGLLSSLTALGRFSLLGDGLLQGPVMPALGSLNKLTALATAHIPEVYVEVCSTNFSGLKKFAIKYKDVEDQLHLDIAFAQSMHSLCKLSLTECYITSRPLPLKSLSCLTKVKLNGCEFVYQDWLSEALEGATQVHRLTLDSMYLTAIPHSICRMIGLRQLKMPHTHLPDLPADFAQLTNLEGLDLQDSTLTSIPVVLEQMTHLKELDLMFPSDHMQLIRPLTFLSAFTNLSSFCLSQPTEDWSSLSMFYIGQLQAVFAEQSMFQVPAVRPEFLY